MKIALIFIGFGLAIWIYALLGIIFPGQKGQSTFGRITESEFFRKTIRILSVGLFGRDKDDE